MKNLFAFIIGLLLAASTALQAQELNAQVNVQTPQLRMTDPKVFQTLGNEVKEFYNGRKWSDDIYAANERINCSFLITITEEISNTRFKGTLTVQSSRPVYNSNYESVIINHQDKQIEFDYAEYQPLEFNENAYLSELTSLLAYYAFIIVGYDAESFSPGGGTPLFLKAQNVVNTAQASKSKGWQSFDGTRNRYWLVQNLTDTKHKPLRDAYYRYHRPGLDNMFTNPTEARANIISALEMVGETHNNNTNSMAVDLFVSAKGTEITNIFADGSVLPPDKVKVLNVMSKIDGANMPLYNRINASTSGRDINMPNSTMDPRPKGGGPQLQMLEEK